MVVVSMLMACPALVEAGMPIYSHKGAPVAMPPACFPESFLTDKKVTDTTCTGRVSIPSRSDMYMHMCMCMCMCMHMYRPICHISQSIITTLLAGSTWPTLTLYSGLLFQVCGGYLCIFQCIFQCILSYGGT